MKLRINSSRSSRCRICLDLIMADVHNHSIPHSDSVVDMTMPRTHRCTVHPASQRSNAAANYRIRNDWHVASVDCDALLAGPLSTQHLLVGVVIGMQFHFAKSQLRLIRDL